MKTFRCMCPSCKRDIYVCKSIFHELGLYDLGRGECPFCSIAIELIFDPEKEEMTATSL